MIKCLRDFIFSHSYYFCLATSGVVNIPVSFSHKIQQIV